MGVKEKCSGALTDKEQNMHSSRVQDPSHNIYSKLLALQWMILLMRFIDNERRNLSQVKE